MAYSIRRFSANPGLPPDQGDRFCWNIPLQTYPGILRLAGSLRF